MSTEDYLRFSEQNADFMHGLTLEEEGTLGPYAEHHSGGLFVLGAFMEDNLYAKAHDTWGDPEDGKIVVHVYDLEDGGLDVVRYFDSGHDALAVLVALSGNALRYCEGEHDDGAMRMATHSVVVRDSDSASNYSEACEECVAAVRAYPDLDIQPLSESFPIDYRRPADAPATKPDRMLGIADMEDLLATISENDLVEALSIAAEQLDVKHDEDAEGYGYATVAEAHALRDRLHATVNAVKR